MNCQIPEYLKLSYQMLKDAFPNGIPEEDYYPLLSVLYNHYSDRVLGALISLVTDKDKVLVSFDDIPKSYHANIDSGRKARIEKLLFRNGWQDVLNEDGML